MSNVFQMLNDEQRRVMFNALSDRENKARQLEALAKERKLDRQADNWKREAELCKEMKDNMYQYGKLVHGVLVKVKVQSRHRHAN